MAPRDELLELIEAYADAKVSENRKLQQLAVTALSEWLKRHDIVAPVDVPAELIPEHLRKPQADSPSEPKT